MSRPARLAQRALAALACVAAVTAVALSGATAAPAAASKSCSVPKYPGSGYFTSLRVSGTACATGRKLVVSYYRCRLKHGRKGRCTSRVLGYSCAERRTSIPTEINARVTCRRGSRSVVHTYQQNT